MRLCLVLSARYASCFLLFSLLLPCTPFPATAADHSSALIPDSSPQQQQSIYNQRIGFDPKNEKQIQNLNLSLEEQAWLAKHPVIRMGGEADWPPYEFVDQTGKFQGLSAEIIHIVEQRLGIHFEILTRFTWSDTLRKAQTHDIDMVSSTVNTPDRQKFLNFSAAFISPPSVIYTRKDYPDISRLEDLNGKSVVIEKGFYLHERIAKEYPEIKLLPVNTTAEALEILSYGKAEAYVGNQGVANWIIEQNALTNLKINHSTAFGNGDLSFGVRKDWPLFPEILNKALASISAEDMLNIRRKWLGVSPEQKGLSLNSSERTWLATHKQIRFAGRPNWLPYEAIDDKDEYIGMVANYLRLIEQRLGINIQLAPSKTWAESLEKLKNGSIDLLSQTQDSEVTNSQHYTQSYLSSPVVIVMRDNEKFVESLEQIQQKKIALVNDHGFAEQIIRQYPTIKFYPAISIQDGLTQLSSGKVDAFLDAVAPVNYQLAELGMHNLRIVGKTDVNAQLAFLVSENYLPLVPLLNRALNDITAAEKQQIYNLWGGKEAFTVLTDYSLLAKIAGVLILLNAVFFYWNRKLKQEVQKRLAAEAQLKSIIDGLPLTVLIADNYGTILLDNPQAKREIADHNSIIGRNTAEFYADPLEKAKIKAVLQMEGSITQRPVRYKISQDQTADCLLSILPISYLGHSAWLAVIFNLTERLKMERELAEAKTQAERANQAKSAFLANMSHEIRTPMNAILGFTELLNEQIQEPRLKSYVKTIHSAGYALLTLINDILDLSKIEAGKMTIQKTAVNPHEMFTELGNMFIMVIRKKNLDLLLEIDPGIPESLMLDVTRLRQVLFNILGNAVKFTDRGYIRLRAKTGNENSLGNRLDLWIDIEDTGIGIPEDKLDSIFSEFTQLDTPDRQSGTGLGLSISRRLAELMGGALSIKSQLGSGSTFTIHLQQVEVAANKSTIAGSFEISPVQKIEFLPATVLVVDDVDNNRRLIKESFMDTQVQILEAKNGLEAIAMTEQHDIQLVLMDIRMPVMDGYQAAKHIKAFKQMPIIALTASVMQDDFERIQCDYFAAYLKKPILRLELITCLSEFLPHRTVTTSTKSQLSQIISLSAAERHVLPEVLQKLQQQTENWRHIQDSNNISAMKLFAQNLIKLAEEYEFKPLQEYAGKLLACVQHFDIHGITDLLQEFPEFQKNLQCTKPLEPPY